LPLREKIIGLLYEQNYPELLKIANKEGNIFRTLISLAYDKKELLAWRAIEAVGIISGETAKTHPALIRNLVQRLLWTMRDESGGIGWSAPEMIGEIVRNSPDEFSDITPVLASFHDEDFLRQGVFRALFRISEKRPDLVASSSDLAGKYLDGADPVVRAYAVKLAGSLGLKKYINDIQAVSQDKSTIKIYESGYLITVILGQIAEQTVIILNKKEII
jgi:hypothetical protein